MRPPLSSLVSFSFSPYSEICAGGSNRSFSSFPLLSFFRDRTTTKETNGTPTPISGAARWRHAFFFFFDGSPDCFPSFFFSKRAIAVRLERSSRRPVQWSPPLLPCEGQVFDPRVFSPPFVELEQARTSRTRYRSSSGLLFPSPITLKNY